MTELYALNPSQWSRLQALLAAYERGELRGSAASGQRRPYTPAPQIGRASASIAATTNGSTTISSGTVRIWDFTGAAGNVRDAGWNVTAYNMSTVSVTSGTWLQLKWHHSGRYLIDFESCV